MDGSSKSRGVIVRGSTGFTLVEVMVALGILAFGILAIASMQMSSLGGTNTAGRVTEATTIAQDRVERFISQPYTHADLTNGSHVDPSPPSRYTVAWTVTDNVPLANTKTIDVDVAWKEKGATKTTSLVYMKMDII
jgi:type IV pilus assembly protein PilV